jgi:hypothetical protein
MISHLPRSLQYIVPILDSTTSVTPSSLIQQLQLTYIQQHPQQVHTIKNKLLLSHVKSVLSLKFFFFSFLSQNECG